MISGLNSSSIMGAIRTASRARETMDTMTRQIATGQKVASVKDDGAAWARANGLRTSAITDQSAQTASANFNVRNHAALAALEEFILGFERVDQILVQAQALPAGASSRSDLNQARLAEQATLRVIAANTAVEGGQLVSYGATGSLTMGTGQFLYSYDETGFQAISSFSSRTLMPGRYELLDLVNADQTQIGTARADIANVLGSLRTMAASAGRYMAGNEGATKAASKSENLKLAAAASLTDADLGKASAALRQAETLQQLANVTVRQAIETYSAFATGLLGNVQRTQRGVLA